MSEQLVVPGTLRGYREWALEPTGLWAINFREMWSPGINTARCLVNGITFLLHPPVETPYSGCTCGFYANYDWTESVALAWPMQRMSILIQGSIKASGRIILHKSGFRAEKVEVEALATSGDWNDILSSFRVPLYQNIGDLVREFPPISVKDLLPKELPWIHPGRPWL